MMNRINTFLFLTLLAATISVISIASAEAQTRVMWQGDTSNLSDPDSAPSVLTIQGLLGPEGEFSIISGHLDRATLRCRKSQDVITLEFPEEEYEVTVVQSGNRFVIQGKGVDKKTAYAVSGTLKPDDSLRATVTITGWSQVFFAGPNDANANMEPCTARLAVIVPFFLIE